MTDGRLPGRCERCEEPIVKVNLADFWPRRFFGKTRPLAYRITWTSLWAKRPHDEVRITHMEITLCDGCWGALLSWCNEPEQERRKIAAEHRRTEERVRKVAEERIEREVQARLNETTS